MSVEPDSAAAPDPAPEAAAATAVDPDRGGPGARLRAAREARQLGVQQVTDALHIEPRMVAAMEADDFAAFDAPVYARGFLRKYATFLELPADEIVAAYERLHAGPGSPTLIPPATAEEPRRDWSGLRLPAIATAVLVLVGGSYWWWFAHAPREAPAAPAVEAASVATPPPTTATAPPDAGPVPAATPATPDAALPGVATAALAGAAGTTAPGTTAAPPPSLATGAALEIDFATDCWIEVTGPTGARLAYGLERAGTSRALPGPGPWRVFLGAADGARLRVAGRPVAIPPANRSGATARLVVGADGAVQ